MKVKKLLLLILFLLPVISPAQQNQWLIEGGIHTTILSFRPKPDKVKGFLYQRIDTLLWGLTANLSYIVWSDEQNASFTLQACPKIGFSTVRNSNLKSIATNLYAQMRWGGGSADRTPHPIGIGAGIGLGAWYYTVNPHDAYNYGISPSFNIEFIINLDEFPVIIKYEQSINGSAANSKQYVLSITGRWRSLFKR
ncbi:MAG: hypothetical protein NZ455_08145 [Bacteroidia bacterium]|nr:hypothetical protein [Bacteroidia bacterium]MDW8347896.1 hypothetical protein [Bacteroidia bacterium]